MVVVNVMPLTSLMVVVKVMPLTSLMVVVKVMPVNFVDGPCEGNAG